MFVLSELAPKQPGMNFERVLTLPEFGQGEKRQTGFADLFLFDTMAQNRSISRMV